MNRFPLFIFVATLLAAAGCSSKPPLTPSIGEAYAGPASLPLRQDIALQSAVVAKVNHGERLEIIQRRRRFVKVRTAGGAEGWTDDRMLLSTEQVAGLRALAIHSKSAPSQGAASTYETLNVHTEPDRQSPSFLQVKEGEKVDVIGRRVTPRNSAPPPPPPPPPAKTTGKKKAAREKKSKDIPPPPPPAVPQLPADWLQLSNYVPRPVVVEEAKPVPMDDWSLIRNAAGQSGWVLTRRLVMAIPDEVAQYAEGRRIASYFSLGETRDGKIVKPTWLWTTVERGLEPHDFDSYRVFVWSLRHHRYETAHIERNLIGYFPVVTNPSGFSLLIKKKDGLRYRRTFTFAENRVKLSNEELVEKPAEVKPELIANEKTEPAPVAESGLRQRIRRLFGR